jgi:hypothetical protein
MLVLYTGTVERCLREQVSHVQHLALHARLARHVHSELIMLFSTAHPNVRYTPSV